MPSPVRLCCQRAYRYPKTTSSLSATEHNGTLTLMLQRLLNAANSRITNLWPAKLNFGKLRAPIATISFDDFPRSAWTVGGRILESHGIRGTYFVSAAFSPDRLRNGAAYGITPGVTYYELGDLAAAYERGHEIGCHTFDHIRAPELTNEALEQS